jgi:hypothetical protein
MPKGQRLTIRVETGAEVEFRIKLNEEKYKNNEHKLVIKTKRVMSIIFN